MSDEAVPAERTLYLNGSVYSGADPFATAMMVEGSTIAWLGSEEAAATLRSEADRVVDLAGAVITPGFVDSHAHITETGLALVQLDLRSARSASEVLEAVARRASEAPGERIVGFGWDETTWDSPVLPTSEELSRAASGASVYLSRVDGHSGLASAALVAELGLGEHPENSAGWLRGEARKMANLATAPVSSSERARAQRTALERAASLGFVALVENGAPQIQAVADVRELLGLEGSLYEGGTPLPEVQALWGEWVDSPEAAADIAARFEGRLLGLGGDLNADGSLGSRTAHLREPYSDDPATRGVAALDADQIAAHIAAASTLGGLVGFHVIGDGGAENILAALGTLRLQDPKALMRAQVRLEHVELLRDSDIEALSGFPVHASMQPRFDGLWGGPDGLYERRLGDRASSMNRFASLLRAGVPLVFGSDSPVTEMNGWRSVKDAAYHHNRQERISARAAFRSHTQVPWRFTALPGRTAAPYDGFEDLRTHALMGQLAVGAPASFAIWDAEELAIEVPDSRVSVWSTDPRAGTPMLPALDSSRLPVCLSTIHYGRTLYEDGSLGSSS